MKSMTQTNRTPRRSALAIVTTYALAVAAFGPSTPARAQSMSKILLNADGGYCDPDENTKVPWPFGPETSCCGSPGRRGCFTSTSAVSNKYSCVNPPNASSSVSGPLTRCDLPAPSCTPTDGPADPNDFTFYVTSDVHLLRPHGFFVDDSVKHVQYLNSWAAAGSAGYAWPGGIGIPNSQNDHIRPPLGVIIAGDFTFNGGPEQLGAFRMLYETKRHPDSLNYPIFPGLGNHETTTQVDADGVKRMRSYIQTTMGCRQVNMDPLTLNYSWDWGPLHVVQLHNWAGENRYVGQPDFGINGLAWLQDDLQHVGKSRPVILIQHLDFAAICPEGTCDKSSSLTWSDAQYANFVSVIQGYNIVGLFMGHQHTMSVIRPEHFDHNGDLLGTQSTGSLTFRRNAKPAILDGFRTGTGGHHSEVSNTEPNHDGKGDFYMVRIKDQAYMDVAPVRWDQDHSPDYGQPESRGFYDGGLGCRKRIDSDYSLVNGVSIVPRSKYPVGGGVTQTLDIQNTLPFTITGPFVVTALPPVQGVDLDLVNREFVDGCASNLNIGNGARNARAYIVLRDASGAEIRQLAPGQKATVTMQFGFQFQMPAPSYYLMARRPVGTNFAEFLSPVANTPAATTAGVGKSFGPLKVQVLDQYGNPRANEPVYFATSGLRFGSAGGAWQVAATTDASGIAATPPVYGGPTTGTYSIAVANAYGLSTTFSLTVTP
jgi:hypothetical protein